MSSKYFGIKDECCSDSNIDELEGTDIAQCKVCKRIFKIKEESLFQY